MLATACQYQTEGRSFFRPHTPNRCHIRWKTLSDISQNVKNSWIRWTFQASPSHITNILRQNWSLSWGGCLALCQNLQVVQNIILRQAIVKSRESINQRNWILLVKSVLYKCIAIHQALLARLWSLFWRPWPKGKDCWWILHERHPTTNQRNSSA